MTGGDVLDIPEISIEDPEWKTFEEIESYASREPSGILQQLLPRELWEYFFAPESIDPPDIRRDRATLVIHYQQIVGICDTIIAKLDIEATSVSNISPEELQEFFPANETTQYPLSLPQPVESKSQAENLSVVRSTIATERELVTIIDHLLSNPAAALLRRSEKRSLRAALTVFSHSAEFSQKIAEHTDWFNKESETVHRQLTHLTDAAGPFLEYQQYLTEPTRQELTEHIESIRTELQTTLMGRGLLVAS